MARNARRKPLRYITVLLGSFYGSHASRSIPAARNLLLPSSTDFLIGPGHLGVLSAIQVHGLAGQGLRFLQAAGLAQCLREHPAGLVPGRRPVHGRAEASLDIREIVPERVEGGEVIPG